MVPDFIIMNDLFMNDVGEHVPEIGNAGASREPTHEFKAGLVTRLKLTRNL